jgi:hypothetical protein
MEMRMSRDESITLANAIQDFNYVLVKLGYSEAIKIVLSKETFAALYLELCLITTHDKIECKIETYEIRITGPTRNTVVVQGG